MVLGQVGSTAASWFWAKYGKELSDKMIGKIDIKWKTFKWKEAETRYRNRLVDIYSTIHIMGNPKPININDIFTDVYILDKISAFRRFDVQELFDHSDKYNIYLDFDEKRTPALPLVLSNKRLFILGKPGAGKTTFLKYLTIKSSEGFLSKTPIFVSLKEWSDSKLELLPFICNQFDICAFPDAKLFIEHLFEKGLALILFDGLDEVNNEGNVRNKLITSITNFSRKYFDVSICVTCRIAATDFSFDQFYYVEIADFSPEQQNIFITKWLSWLLYSSIRYFGIFDQNFISVGTVY